MPNNSKTSMAVASALGLLLLSSAGQALDLTASSSNPSVFFEDSTTNDGQDWAIIAHEAPAGSGEYLVVDRLGSNNNVIFRIAGSSGSTNNINSLAVDSSGDMNLADGSVFIDRSTNNMGVGTTTPEEALHLKTQGGNIMLEGGTGTPYSKWQIATLSGGNFWIKDVLGTSTTPFYIHADAPDNSIRIGTAGVGMGTSAPESALHIKKAGAVLTVEDTNAGGVSNIIELKRPGSVGFSMENTALGEAWDFRTNGTGGFLVSNIGVPGSKFQINLDGRVFMAGTNFDLKPDGTLTLAGNSNALQHVDTSSRESKTDFEKVNAKEVMDKIKTLEVSKWRYKDTSAKGRHIGPVAEDFYSLFKLGADDKHIVARDIASIALVAAKELQKKSDAMDAKTLALKSKTSELELENKSLKARLASLEKLVTKLASGNGFPLKQGNEIVLK